jgi:transcriptional regulator with XRE-family HTH domain
MVGSTIYATRVSRGLSQKDLAKRLRVSASYLCQIEKSLKKPTLSILKRISKELGIPFEILQWSAIDIPQEIPEDKKQLFISAKAIIEAYNESVIAGIESK